MRRPARWCPLVVLCLSLGAVVVVGERAPVRAFGLRDGVRLNSHEARLVDLVNRARADRGLVRLKVVAAATDVARPWSVRLASAGSLSHNPQLRPHLSARGCGAPRLVGENVAYNATSADEMFQMYMDSPGHRANILEPTYRVVGMASVERNTAGFRYVYNTQVFASSCASYPDTREPAHGMFGERRRFDRRVDYVTGEDGKESRAIAVTTGTGLKVSSYTVDGVGPGDGALRMTFTAVSLGPNGTVDLVLKDALDFSTVRGLTLAMSASTTLPVRIQIDESWGPAFDLGEVLVRPGAPQVSTRWLPDSARRYVNHIRLKVGATALGGLLNAQSATLALYRITLEV